MLTLDAAIATAVEALCARQGVDGPWEAQCEFDPSYTALFLLFRHCLGWQDGALDADMVRYLRHEQLADGGWGGSPDSPAGLDATVLCYAALRAAGIPAHDTGLVRAREVVQHLGGVVGIGFIPRLMLRALGQIPQRALPYVSPRVAGLLQRLPWDKVGMIALGVVPFALLREEPVRCLPPERGSGEIMPDPSAWRCHPVLPGRQPSFATGRRPGPLVRILRSFLEGTGEVLRIADRLAAPRRARRAAVAWILDHRGADGTFGEGLVPSAVNLMALGNLDEERCRHAVAAGMKTLLGWVRHDHRGTWMPAAPSSTHDTARIAEALGHTAAAASGLSAAVDWLRARQSSGCNFPASVACVAAKTGGWGFGRVNPWLADTDDTALAMLALRPFRHQDEEGWRRGLVWLLAMQQPDGGWAGFTTRCGIVHRTLAAITDPRVASVLVPDEDITARVLLLLGPLREGDSAIGRQIGAAVDAGIRFLWKKRRPDGTWFGRWSVNHTYATAQVVEAFAACGCGEDSRVRQSVRWLEGVQNADGGWGESKLGYHTGRFEPGPSNPLVSAFVLRGLAAAGLSARAVRERAVAYLLAAQREDGLWDDPGWNGVFVPGSSYIRYDPSAFVLGALAMARDTLSGSRAGLREGGGAEGIG